MGRIRERGRKLPLFSLPLWLNSMFMAKEKKQLESLEDVLKSIEKDFGEGIISMGNKELGALEVIPFTIPSMNRITTIGGVPKGRIIEFHGMDGTFKTTFTLDLILSCQRAGGKCAFIDAEYSFSPEYAEALGVNVEDLILIHPSSAEEAFAVLERLTDTKQIDLLILDSIAALSPSTELANEFGTSNMGVMARLMGQFFRKLVAKVGKANMALVMINQLREQLGGYVPMKTTPGGNALRFYASMRFEISKSPIKEGKEIKGVNLTVKCVKNKLGVPYLQTEVEAIYGQGIDVIKDLINEACIMGIIDKAGAGWMTYKEIKIQGLDAMKQLVLDNEELYSELENQVYDR